MLCTWSYIISTLQLFSWGGAVAPDAKQPHNVTYNARTDSLMTYADELSVPITIENLKQADLPVVKTATVQANMDSFFAWLEDGNKQPLLLVGPEGCGKG